MGHENLTEFESFVVQKGWMTKGQVAGALNIQRAQALSGDIVSLAEICLAEKYVTPEQFAEITSQIKIAMVCPACNGRFKVGGKRPQTGFACPKCGAPLKPIVEVAVDPTPVEEAPPVEKPRPVPARGPRAPLRPRAREQVEPRPARGSSKLVVSLSIGGAAAAILIGLVVVALSQSETKRSKGTVEGETGVAGAERGRKGESGVWMVQPAGKTEAVKRPVETAIPDLRLIREIEEKIGREDWRGASAGIHERLSDLNTPPALVASLQALRVKILDRLNPKYEEFLKEAQKLASEGKFEDARNRVLQATAWGVREIDVRAKRDAEAIPRQAMPAPAAALPDLKAIIEERAQREYHKIQNMVELLERDGRIAQAIKVCESFPEEYRDTVSGRDLVKLMDRLRGRLAGAGKLDPAGPEVTKPETKAVPVAVNARAPRGGAYTPGGLSDEEKTKRQADLANAAKKDQKGAKKAAAQKRQDWLDKLEKEKGIYDVTTLADKGDPSKRVDIVIVSAGFPKSDAKRVDQLADGLRNSLLKVDPFQNYPDYINFHRVKIDDGGGKAHIPYQVAQNILTCDHRKAIEYAAYAPSYDLVVVICNVKGVRSTGGPPLITIDADLDLGRTFRHEMGHAFASLNDEYVDNSLAGSRPFREDEEDEWATNVTSVSNPKLVKWHYWMPDVWPAAHEMNRLPAGHKVGCFEGGAYQARGVWRPEEQCLMRMGDKYCVVCFEQVEKKFYRLIAPIDEMRPRRTLVPAWIDETITLEGDALKTMTTGERIGKFDGFWYVNAKPRHANAKNLTTILTLQASELGAGQHEVGLRVDFSNKRIRRDDGWLSSSAGWKLDIAKHKKPKWEGPAQVQAKVGQPVTFEMKIDNPDPVAFRVEAQAMPEGTTYEGGRFTWTPSKAHQGGWRPKFVLTDGVRSVEKAVDLAVLDVGEKNFEPIFSLMDARVIGEGEKLEFPLEVVDVDGDNLVFTSPNLPDGAELDLYEGVLRWRATGRQAGSYPGILVEAWDGRRRVKTAVDIIVEDRVRGSDPRSDLAVSLRSGWPQVRAQAIGELSSRPKVYQFMEAARLLRDKSKEVWPRALELLRGLQGSADDPFMAMMIRDIAPHAWHFTDHKEILDWLDGLATKGDAASPDTKALRGALRAIERYNKDRAAP